MLFIFIKLDAFSNTIDSSIHKAENYIVNNKYALAIDELNNIDLKVTSEKQKITVNDLMAKAHESLENYYLAVDFYLNKYDLIKNSDDYNNLFQTLIDLIRNHLLMSHFIRARKYFKHCEKIISKVDDPKLLSNYYKLVSISINVSTGKKGEVKYAKKALTYALQSKNKILISSIYCHLAQIYDETNKSVKAIEYFNKAIGYLNEEVHIKNLNHVKYNKAVALKRIKKYDDALILSKSVYESYSKSKNLTGQMITSLFMASIYNIKKDCNKAIRFINKSEQLNKRLKINRFFTLAAEEKAKYYACVGKVDSCIKYISKIHQFNESEKNFLGTRIYTEMNYKLDMLSKQRQLIQYEKKHKIMIMRIFYLSLIVIVILVFIYFYLKIIKQRNKKDKELFRVKKEVIERKLHEKEQEKLLAEKEIQLQNKELLGFAMHVKHNEEILKDVNLVLNEIKNDNNKTLIQNFKIKINNRLSDSADYKLYQLKSEETKLQFVVKLNRLNILSEDQKQLCILIKSGLSNKEIAQTLSKSEKSIEMKRYRLRKSLQLPTDINLLDYLSSL